MKKSELIQMIKEEIRSLLKEEDYSKMPLNQIASKIQRDWKNVDYTAKPYLSAMYSLDDISDDYGMDSGSSIVAYFLSNATSWRGPVAKEIKAELNKRLKKVYGK